MLRMVYTDGTHITAQSLSELCDYGQKVGLDSFWLQAGKNSLHPHFVICGKVKERVLADVSVKRVTTRELIDICKQYFTPPSSIESATTDQQSSDTTTHLPSESDYERMLKNIFERTGIKREK
jgi:hypothetical protein